MALGSYLLMTLQDAITKGLVTHLPVLQVLLLRSVIILAMSVVGGRAPGLATALGTPQKRLLVLRGVVLLAAWLLFYEAARSLPFGQLISLYFVTPLIVAVLSGPLLNEWPSGLHWLATIVGFFGVVVVAGPPLATGSMAVLLALAAAGLWSLSLLMLRFMAASAKPMTQVVYSNAIFILGTVAFAVPGWMGLTAKDWMLVALMGVAGGVSQYLMYRAAQDATAYLLATLEYSALIFAFLIGYVVFGEVPPASLATGSLLILAAGLLSALRRRAAVPTGSSDALSPSFPTNAPGASDEHPTPRQD